MYKITPKDFEVFKAESEKWIKTFGLIDWEVNYDYDLDGDCRASCQADYVNRITINSISLEWAYKPKVAEIKRMAFHEVCELLLSPMRLVAEARFINEDELETARHSVIRVLENTIFHKGVKP